MHIIKATLDDISFITEGYTSAQQSGAVTKQTPLRPFLEHHLKVSNRLVLPRAAPHPFIEDSPFAKPLDDIFVLQSDNKNAGLFWLRNFDDAHLAPITFAEFLLFWVHPDYRGRGLWPTVDAFVRQWTTEANKTLLMGRCLKPSRRMAELFNRSGYKLEGTSPSGMTVHSWKPN